MMISDYNLWIDYHQGKINRELTEKEKKEIRASDFAMHLLVPTDALINACGGYNNMVHVYLGNKYQRTMSVRQLAKKFCVLPEVVLFKMQYEIQNYKKDIEKQNNLTKKGNNKILKKQKNIIYVDFKKIVIKIIKN